MKQPRLIGTILFVSLLCMPLWVFANNKPKAQPRPVRFCVQCSFHGSCRSCKGGGGGVYCDTFNCGACEEIDQCISTDRVNQTPSDSKQPLKLSAKVIREISVKHPRFAVTLAEMNVYGITPGERRVYWTPVELSPSDVEAFLNKEAHSRFFKRYDTKVRRLNGLIQKGEISDIVYAISIKQTEEGSWSIKMQVEGETTAASVDPAYSKLEIKVATQPAQTALGQQSSRKIVTWEIQ